MGSNARMEEREGDDRRNARLAREEAARKAAAEKARLEAEAPYLAAAQAQQKGRASTIITGGQGATSPFVSSVRSLMGV